MNAIRRVFAVISVTALMMLVSACGTTQPTPTVAAVPGVTTLWPDVPVFSDSTPDAESNQFFNQAPDRDMSDVSLTYYSPKQASAVAEFYSDKRMKQYGWLPQSYGVIKHFSVGDGQGAQLSEGETAGGCEMSTFKGKPSAICTFSKMDDSTRYIALSIFVGVDTKTNQTEIDYTRIVGSAVKK